METRGGEYASDKVEGEFSPVAVAATVCAVFLAATALAVAARSWLPILVMYPLSLILAVGGMTWRRRGALRVDKEGVWWRGSLAVERGAIVHVARTGARVTLRTDSSLRPLHHFHAPDESSAQAMVLALGDADARPAVDLRVGSPVAAYGGPAYIALLVPSVLCALGGLLSLADASVFPVNLGFFAAGAAGLTAVFAPTRVTLGADGMLVRWLWRVRWIPWRTVESVTSVGARDAIVLGFKGGGSMRISAEAAFALTDADVTSDLVARVRAVNRAAAEARPHAVAAALSRGGDSTVAWVERLRSLADRGSHGYRAVAVTPEDLALALRDHGAAPSLRVAAAIAYAPAGGAGEVRLAAEAVASTRVRAALDAAAEGDEVAIASALDALEREA